MKIKAGYYKGVLPVIAVLLCANSYAQKTVTFIGAHNTHMQYEGRIGMNKPGVAEIYWPGSSCKIRFRGTEVKAILKDERGHNYFNVIIDEDSICVLKLDTLKTVYILASHLREGEHTVELFRRTGWVNGTTWFYGFQLPPHAQTIGLPDKTRIVEFYGNSITTRHFNARYSCIASSGIGIMISWGSFIMQDIYDRLNPEDSASKWDFFKSIPDIVVINLFQNDNALVNLPDHPQFKRKFGDKAPTEDFIIASYRRFVQGIRNHYPEAYIICVLGNMDAVKPGSPWPGYIEKAVGFLQDKKIYTHFFPYKNTSDHPNAVEQQQMARSLIRFINDHIKW